MRRQQQCRNVVRCRDVGAVCPIGGGKGHRRSGRRGTAAGVAAGRWRQAFASCRSVIWSIFGELLERCCCERRRFRFTACGPTVDMVRPPVTASVNLHWISSTTGGLCVSGSAGSRGGAGAVCLTVNSAFGADVSQRRCGTHFWCSGAGTDVCLSLIYDDRNGNSSGSFSLLLFAAFTPFMTMVRSCVTTRHCSLFRKHLFSSELYELSFVLCLEADIPLCWQI